MDGVDLFDLEVGPGGALVRIDERRGEILEETSIPLAEWRAIGRAPMTSVSKRRGIGFAVEGDLVRGFAVRYPWDYRDSDLVRVPLAHCRLW